MKKVLVVDDEPAIVTLLEYNLKQANFEVESALTGLMRYQWRKMGCLILCCLI